MKGIIIYSHVDGREDITQVAIPNGIATVAVNILRNKIVCWGTGTMTMPAGQSASWNGGRMRIGDSLSLHFADIIDTTPPSNATLTPPPAEQYPVEVSDTNEWKKKLIQYKRLEKFLKESNIDMET
ncbi:MAG: hypothetical protein HUK01_08490 [Bacteroidaceae bacterium]|nr:hypothetical protein [Bacteroidaceae bacterium]